ncbi:MAG: hypothetical protein JXR68_02945 [Bacteroidales bacterium]|nr:hypothetical protein [Bacteroidales bacterium]
MKKSLFWWLSVPVVLGGYFLVKKFKTTCDKNLEKILAEDKSFNYDEKSIAVIKSHVTRNINQLTENCNWFAIGKTGKPNSLFYDFEVKELFLLAKSADVLKVQELEDIYTEKFKDSNKTSELENNEDIIETDDGFFYLYLAIG